MNEDTKTTAATDELEQASPPEQGTQPVTPALFDEPDETTQDETPTSTDNPPEEQSQEQNTIEELKIEDIKLPDGATYDEELSKSFLGILNDGNLSRKELAQKLFNLYNEQGIKMLESLKAAEIAKGKKFEADLSAEKAQWLKQCQSDEEYGGQNWESSQVVIDRGCKQLATPEAIKLMQAYNLNTHPEIVRMFYRAGKLASEDKSQVEGSGANKPQDAAQIIFGESLKEYHRRKEE